MCSTLPPPKGDLVPLTPEDVDNKRFSTARVMRQGYDMTEVDNFLDEVAAEMKRLHSDLAELRGKASSAPEATAVAQASGSSSAATADGAASDEKAAEANASDGTTSEAESAEAEGKHADPGSTDEEKPAETAADGEGAEKPTPGTHSADSEDDLAEGETEVARVTGTRGELLRVATTDEAAAAAARMLELAGRNADELVADARSQADRIVSEASGRAEELDGETEQRRAKLVADLERDHQELKDEVEDLRAFEREYRAQLRNYFQQQLEALDAQGGGVTLAEDLHEDEGEIGSRLRSILAEEEDEGGSDAPGSDSDGDDAQGDDSGRSGETAGDQSEDGSRPTA